jgi:uncharacterized protein (DUF433 family)
MKFQTIRIEGNTISADILEKISEGEYKGQQPKDFRFETGVKVKDEIARAWADAQNQWKIFKSRTSDLDDTDTGLPEVRKYWMIPLLGLLDYNIEPAQADKLDSGNSYPISHRENKLDRFPVYVVGFKDKQQKAPEERSTLDIKPSNATRKMSPHALVQEYVNLTEYAYGIVTNGLQIRLLRDSSRLVKLSFLEFDLEQMMEEEAFADFALLFRVLHASRLPRSRQETNESFIEQYHLDSIESGARIREGLSEAVEKSIRSFANGFLKHHANQALRDAIIKRDLTPEKYYQQQLRLIYRLLFLMVTEERNLIYPDNHNKKLRDIYYQYYSVERLRRMVDKRFLADPRYSDHWEGLKHTFQLFEKEHYGGPLAIKPLNGELFGINALDLLNDSALDNQVLLECIRNLTVFVNKNTHQVTRVNYASLNVEEFGSVYEGLLEYDPVLNITDDKNISFDFKTGEGRSSSGSHYTPEELVQPLIKHSLEYVIEDKLKEKNREAALLSIKVCDVACGSGHILLSAARRIATEVARMRTGEDQPTPGTMRVATRDVIKSCIYGVDKNPLAVELCKVALWLESHNPGEPLGFLDHHIKCGDAIVGLAHREELESGIPDEAFKTLPGDDKEVASSLLKQNRVERKEREVKSLQLKTEFDITVQGNVQEALEEYGHFIKLPERTPEEVEARQRAYNKFLKGKGYSFLKAMADTQIAQFFIPKTQVNKDRLMTDGEFRRIMSGYGSWKSSKHYSTMVQHEQRFFHWFLEFPEVFQQDGFDCILGNPPYLGGTMISGANGKSYYYYLTAYYSGASNRCDLAGYFMRRIFRVIRDRGFLSLITTNSISEGDTRLGSIENVLSQGGIINHAAKSIKWPGEAAVIVSLISIYKGTQFKGRVELQGSSATTHINSFLESGESEVPPNPLHSNSELGFNGSYVFGDGFLLEPQEAYSLIKSNSSNKKILFPYLNGEDLNTSFDQSSSRWVINFGEMTINEAKEFESCFRIVESKVKPFRESKSKDVASFPWWQFWRTRKNLYQRIEKLDRVLIHTRVTKTHGFSFVPTNLVFSDATVIIASDRASTLCYLQSSLHEAWAWKYSSRLKSDRRYSVEDCFQNFPFPIKDASEELNLEKIGEDYHQHRSHLMSSLKIGLTRTYNLYHSQYLTSVDIEKQSKQSREVCEKSHQDILKLRELHVQMDQAVIETYGWQDVQLRHNFYEVDYLPESDWVRYTIHPEARKEILKRLLDLNHKTYEEEVKAGMWDKKRADKPKKIDKVPVFTGQESLFSDNFEPMLEFDLNTGIYSSRDAAEITGINMDTIRRWFKELSNASYEGLGQGDVDKLRISFHGLIELVVIGTLRDNNFSLQKILKAREDLKKKTRNHYPFATSNIKKLRVAGSSILFEASATSIITLDGTGQFNLEIIREFFKHIEFSTEGIAKKLFPVKGKGKIAIDPKVGQGKPVIKGKSVWAETIAKMYTGPESISLLRDQYNLKDEEIFAAVEYCSD